MSRTHRIRTVVRIRELQERIAEAETVGRRRAVAARERAVAAAHDDLDERTRSRGSGMSFHEFALQQALLDGAVANIDQRAEELGAAESELATATRAWHEAHRRHDAVERLLDRAVAADVAEEQRVTQSELDDIVSTRHGRPSTISPLEETP